MAIKKDGKRARYGQMLKDAESQASNAFSVLDSVRNQLVAGKTKMQSDADFTAEDVEEVDQSIAFIDLKYTS